MNTRSVSQSNCCLVYGFAADITTNFSQLPTIADTVLAKSLKILKIFVFFKI